MSRNAVIYIRTSSESQAEKSSPVEQEADCRRLAQEKGFAVIRVYRDTEKYRVKNRLVEPSGARTDRPAFQTMLLDASRGDFDMIMAWREDRLYRGIRPMLAVLDVVHKNQINILLAKEYFDPTLAPLRAWVAQMELDGMRERMSMGVKARLRAGKANTGQDRYGYVRVGEKINIEQEEAVWVRQIFKWYTQSVPLLEIRKRLIAANAPQKEGSIPRRIQWARSSIQAILKSANEYSYGGKIQFRAGEKYQILVEPYETFIKMRAENKTYPSQRMQYDYLLAGHLKCACNLTWRARTNTHRRSRKGEWVERKTHIGTYFCSQPHPELRPANCPKSVSAKQGEAQVWDAVCEFVLHPAYLLAQAKRSARQFEHNYSLFQQNLEQAQKNLALLDKERHEFITYARRTRMSDDEFGTKISYHYEQAEQLQHRIAGIQAEIDAYADLDFDARVRAYVQDIQAGIENIINAKPQTKEEQHSLFLMKKRLVDDLVHECVIDGNRQLHIKFRADIPNPV